MNVADYIVDVLSKNNVRFVFGYQGGAILKLVDSLSFSKDITYIQNYHEQASSFCADAYSRITNNLGVAIATSGPGATNLITGIANAYLDSIPTLFLTGQEFSTRIGSKSIRSNGFQDLDIVNIVKPITKYAKTILNPNDVPYELEKAIFIAKTGRPGAVLIDVPIDIQLKNLDLSRIKNYKHKINNKSHAISKEKMESFFSLLKKSRRPVILAGGGIRLASANEELKLFSDKTGIPVALTLNGLDVCESNIGFSGMYGNLKTSLSIYCSDLLIVLGSRLGQHQVGKTQRDYTKAKVVHVDLDVNELQRCLNEELSIEADVKNFLQEAIFNLDSHTIPSFCNWAEKIKDWGEKYPSDYGYQFDEDLSPIDFLHRIQKYLNEDAVITSDVGLNQMWVAQMTQIKKGQRILNSSGLGSMGYSLPAAIGAKFAKPKSQVFAFMGDGGFQLNMQELQLVSEKKLDIKIIVLNNSSLGMIKSTQQRHFSSRFIGVEKPDFSCPNIHKIAEAYSMSYCKFSKIDDIKNLADFCNHDGPAIAEVIIKNDFPAITKYDFNDLLEKEYLNV